MGCTTCKTGTVGCKNNGNCLTGGCNKLNTFDWIGHMDQMSEESFDLFEVRFKNGRKDFYRNENKLEIYNGDSVVVSVPNGHHIGYVSMTGALVRLQMKKKKVSAKDVGIIYRLASSLDLEKYEKLRAKEKGMVFKSREIIRDLKLEMKLTDVEYQADSLKATFYYSAEVRVDFRELIKYLAAEFKIRVEMRQISQRQEASRLGGIGSCGRELCCSTWLTDFQIVPSTAARYQNLSLNPTKLSGQCGRLKCCLNYELDTYKEALSDIPEVNKPLMTDRGLAYLHKTDIFRKIMWFGYKNDNNWHSLDIARVSEILELNKKGKKPASLTLNQEEQTTQENTRLNADLVDMDNKFTNANHKRKKRKKKHRKKQPKNE